LPTKAYSTSFAAVLPRGVGASAGCPACVAAPDAHGQLAHHASAATLRRARERRGTTLTTESRHERNRSCVLSIPNVFPWTWKVPFRLAKEGTSSQGGGTHEAYRYEGACPVHVACPNDDRHNNANMCLPRRAKEADRHRRRGVWRWLQCTTPSTHCSSQCQSIVVVVTCKQSK